MGIPKTLPADFQGWDKAPAGPPATLPADFANWDQPKALGPPAGLQLSNPSTVPNARIRNLPNPAEGETSPAAALYHGAKTGAQLATLPMSAELPSMSLKQILGMLAGSTVGKVAGGTIAASGGAGELGQEASGDVGAMVGGGIGAKLAENPMAQAIVKTGLKIADVASFNRLSKIWDSLMELPAEYHKLSPKAIPTPPPIAPAAPSIAGQSAATPSAPAPTPGGMSPQGWYYLGRLQEIAARIEAEETTAAQAKNVTPSRAAALKKPVTPSASSDDLTNLLQESVKRAQAAKGGNLSDLK